MRDVSYPVLVRASALPVPAFQWNAQQANALRKVGQWFRTDDPLFRLFGFAGTGKTTLTKYIAANANRRVSFLAFTGKAALVMRRMGCSGAKTIHSVIYIPVSELVQEAKAIRRYLEEDKEDGHSPEDIEKALDRFGTSDIGELEKKLRELRKRIDEGPSWTLRDEIASEPDLIIVDEVSMVNEELARDLLSFKKKILVLGDPFQLPPIDGAGFFIAGKPDVMLTEVVRQALDNPIIAMATRVRSHGAYALKPGAYGDSRVYAKGEIADTMPLLLGADQVLTGMHPARHSYNARIRAARGFSGNAPMVGERVLCCRNNHSRALLNGSLWSVLSCRPEKLSQPDGDFLVVDIES